MPLFLNDYGLEFFTEDDDTFRALMMMVAQDGKAITGYYGLPYLNLHFGHVQMIDRIIRNEEGNYEASGLDVHSMGNQMWSVRIQGANIDREDKDLLEKRVLVTKPDGSGGMAVVNLVNADVLPSFLKDDLITMQMIGLPLLIQYFEDEDAYEDSLPPMDNGGKLMLEDGFVFPNGFLRNRGVNSPEFETDEYLDDLTNIRGTVKGLYYGKFAFQGQEENTFIRCMIDTQFGPLEIVHTYDQVEEAQRKSLHEGAIVSFFGVLSGDPAINQYAEGIVRDEEHDLALLRYSFVEGDPERLRSVLTEDATYRAECDDLYFQGPDEIIKRIKYVQSCNKTEETRYFAHMATIQSVDGKAIYEAGKRCIVLAHGEETAYESIAFIEVNEEGLIQSIVTSTDASYHFAIDEKPGKRSFFDDVELPESVAAQLLGRAHFDGIVDIDISDEEILADTTYEYEFENNIEQLLKAAPEDLETNKDTLRENLFGYLFAKAAELDYLQRHAEMRKQGGLVGSYSAEDAWGGSLRSNLEPEKHEVLEKALHLGKRYYGDFSFFQSQQPEDSYDDNLRKALMLMQLLGVWYGKKHLG